MLNWIGNDQSMKMKETSRVQDKKLVVNNDLKTGMAGLLAVVTASDEEFNNLADAIDNSTGSAQEMAKIMADNIKGDFTLLKSAVEGTALSFGEVLEPALRNIVQSFTGVVQGFGNMSDWSKKVLIDITALGVGTGVAFKVFGTATTTLGKFIESISKSDGTINSFAKSLGLTVGQFSLWTAGIGLVVGALGGLIYWIETADVRQAELNKNLKQSMSEAKESIQSNTEAIKTAKDALFEVQELENKINSTDNTEQKAKLTEELLDKKKEILQLFPEIANGFSSEEQAMENLNGSMQEYIKLKERELEIDQRKLANSASEYLKENGVSMSSSIESYEKSQKSYDDIQKALDLLAQYDEQAEITYSYIDGYSGKVITKTKKIGDLQSELIDQQSVSTQRMEEYYEKINDEAEALLNKQAGGAKLTQEELKALEAYQKYLSEGYTGELGEHNVSKGILETFDIMDDFRKKIEQCVESGKFSMEELNASLDTMSEVAERDFGKLNGTSSLAFAKMKNELANEVLSLEEFNGAVETMAFFASEEFNNLSEASQSSLSKMMEGLANGTISTEAFQTGVNSYLDLVADGYDRLNEAEQLALSNMSNDLATGKMTAEEFALGIEAMQFLASDSFYKLDEASQQVLKNMVDNYNDGNLSAQEFTLGVSAMEFASSEAFANLDTNSQQMFMNLVQAFSEGQITAGEFAESMAVNMGLSEEAINKLASMSTTDMQTLMTNFFSGKLSSEELQEAIDLMHSNPDLPADVAIDMLAVRNAMKQTEEERDILQEKIDTMKGNSNWSSEFSGQIETVIDEFNEGKLSGDDLQKRIDELKDNPKFSQSMTEELEQIIQAMIENKTKGDELQKRIDELKGNDAWAKLMSGQFEMVQTSASDARSEVRNLSNEISGLQSKTVTLSVNKVTTETVKTLSSTPGNSGGASAISMDDDFDDPYAQPISVPYNDYSPPSPEPYVSSNGVNSVDGSPSASSRAISTYSSSSNYSFSTSKDYSSLTDEEKALQQEREKLESDANSAIQKLRDKLYKALKAKIEKQKEIELSIYDARIEAIKKEMALLDQSISESAQDNLNNEISKLEKLQAELAKWQDNNSAFSKQKQQELLEAIKEQEEVVKKAEVNLKKEQLQAEIDAIEEEKDLISQKYDTMLTEEALYLEANKLLVSQNMSEMLNLIEEYAPDFSDIGLLLGQSLAEGIMESISQGLDGFNYIKNGNVTSNGSSTSSNTVSDILNEVTSETTSSKGRVTTENLNVRSDAGTNNSVIGSVYKGEEVEILGEKDGWYNIQYWSDVYNKYRQGWVSGAYIQKFHTGGIIGDVRNQEGLALVQSGERVLSREQTEAFEKLVDWLPYFGNLLNSIKNLGIKNKDSNSNKNITFNNNYNVTNKTEFDMKSNMETMEYRQKQQLRKAGIM